MTFLRRKSSNKNQTDVPQTEAVPLPSINSKGNFNHEPDYAPIRPKTAPGASTTSNSSANAVRRVSMVPIPRPTSSYNNRSRSTDRVESNSPNLPSVTSGQGDYTSGLGIRDGFHQQETLPFAPSSSGILVKSTTYPMDLHSGPRPSIASLYPSPNAGHSDQFRSIEGGSPSSLPTGSPSFQSNSPSVVTSPSITAGRASRMTKSPSLPNFVRRNHRVAPPLNLIVVGASETGKTGWIRTFLSTLELGNEAEESKRRIRGFGFGSGRDGVNQAVDKSIGKQSQEEVRGRRKNKPLKLSRTNEMETISVEVIGPQAEKIALTCVDTVALDPFNSRELTTNTSDQAGSLGFSNAARSRNWDALDELKVERQLTKVMRLIEDRFVETLKTESQVIRPSARAPTSHFHLCLYFIHPDSITNQPRRSYSVIQSTSQKSKSKSKTEVTAKASSSSSSPLLTKEEKDDSVLAFVNGGGAAAAVEDDGFSGRDDLMGSGEAGIKESANGLVRAVSENVAEGTEDDTQEGGEKEVELAHEDSSEEDEDDEDDLDDDMGMSEIDLKCIKKLSKIVHVLPIIARADEMTISRLEQVKAAVRRDLYRSGLSFGVFGPTSKAAADEEQDVEENSGLGDDDDDDVGGDASLSSGKNSSASPTRLHPRKKKTYTPVVVEEELIESPTFDEHLPFAVVAPELVLHNSRAFTARHETSEDTDGVGDDLEVFERRFKYGVLNVLDPAHCDFTLLKEAVFSKIKTLKETTRLDKYEPFRTQTLLDHRRLAASAGLGGGGGGSSPRSNEASPADSPSLRIAQDILKEVEKI